MGGGWRECGGRGIFPNLRRQFRLYSLQFSSYFGDVNHNKKQVLHQDLLDIHRTETKFLQNTFNLIKHPSSYYFFTLFHVLDTGCDFISVSAFQKTQSVRVGILVLRQISKSFQNFTIKCDICCMTFIDLLVQ